MYMEIDVVKEAIEKKLGMDRSDGSTLGGVPPRRARFRSVVRFTAHWIRRTESTKVGLAHSDKEKK